MSQRQTENDVKSQEMKGSLLTSNQRITMPCKDLVLDGTRTIEKHCPDPPTGLPFVPLLSTVFFAA